MLFQNDRDKILIIDFGSQVTKLIARRIRDLGVYSEIITPFQIKRISNFKSIKGIILSGGPSTVTKRKFQSVPRKIFELKKPILGICYGLQLIAKLYGGKIRSSQKRREFGRTLIFKKKNSIFTKNFFKQNNSVWMSHQDAVVSLPRKFSVTAFTKDSKLTVIENDKDKIYGVQFHPEVTHTDNGKQIFKNFLFSICKIKKKWSVLSQKKRLIDEVKNKVKNDKVLCALSGGVDSSVVALIVNQAIKKNLICIMVDTGLMRKNEFKYTYKVFKNKYKLNVRLINASKLFLKKLKNVSNPEKKRKIIGKLFIELFEQYSKKLRNVFFLAQGTLYPDVIESIAASGKKKVTIKSHHNVGGLPERMKMDLVEPLRELFKDEVRDLGRELGIPDQFIDRHPFPGPGLAIRIPGEITNDKIEILRKADTIYIDEIKKAGLYKEIWQAFVVLLPVQTVGVMGDERTYEYVCALRAVTSLDGMTADYYPYEQSFLANVSTRIINEVKGINRVVYDITSKPPGTIEWE